MRTINDTINDSLKDPEFKKEWEALEPQHQVINAIYPAIFEPEGVGYSVYVPDIPGCNTQGDTMEEALEMVHEAIRLALEGVNADDYPVASRPQDIKVTGKQFVVMVQ